MRTTALLAATIALAACGSQEGGNNVQADSDRMQIYELAAEGSWAVVDVRPHASGVALVSKEEGTRRLLVLGPQQGYTVSAIDVDCATGSYSIADTASSPSDAIALTGYAELAEPPYITTGLERLCAGEDDLPEMRGSPQEVAPKARMEAGKQAQAGENAAAR